MSIERVLIPTPTAPAGLVDYQAILDRIHVALMSFAGAEIVDGSTIRGGRVINIGNVPYFAESDTAITGSASNYVKITPSGATASAAFVANLTGVTWNDAYSGYYDGSGNLHVFDEGLAVASGVITAPKTRTGLSAGPRKRTFTASGTFVVPTGVTEVWVTGCAAGGNGGAGQSSPSGGQGGGAGRHVVKKSVTVTPGASITVTLGAVGANTTFGGLLTMAFGTAGSSGALDGDGGGASAGGSPGSGGAAGGGFSSGSGSGGGGGGAGSPIDATVAGSNGASGTGASPGAGGAGGSGGGGGGGGGGGTSATGGAGGAGNAYGSGGGGGGAGGGGTGGAGGAGGPAILIVEW